MIRVLIVEDHVGFRQALAFTLGYQPDIQVVAQAGSLAGARRGLRGADVVLLDLDLPDGDGLELVSELHAANPRGKVLILTASVARRDLARAVEAGVFGVLHKSATIDHIIGAIRRVQGGERLYSHSEALDLLHLEGERRERRREVEEAIARLTSRELEVLRMLAGGMSDKEIARRLILGPDTVRAHVSHILGKLGVQSRLQAILFALRHGVVKLDAVE